MADPIEAFVTVRDPNSRPVTGLRSADFVVTLDGTAVNAFALGLPPAEDPAQYMSIAFVTEYLGDGSGITDATRVGITDFVNGMSVGSYAALVKLQLRFVDPDLGPTLQAFTPIDGGAGTASLIEFAAVPYGGPSGLTGVFTGIVLAVDQFIAPPVPLPDGPKAIILIDDGLANSSYDSQSTAMAHANANGIPIFTIGVGDVAQYPDATAEMAALAADTGGIYAPASNDAAIAAAFARVSWFLNDAYKLTLPQTAVTDCQLHLLEVGVLDVRAQGDQAAIEFSRCDSTPDSFELASLNVAPGSVAVSDPIAITGIESPVSVTVFDGEYAIGCGSTFTSAPGFIQPGENICVRHTASATDGATTESELIVGGVSAFFTTTSDATPPPPPPPAGGSSGGGGTGVIDLLLVLSALIAQRRMLTAVVARFARVAGRAYLPATEQETSALPGTEK